jgi:hypothetical protein
MVHDHPPHAWRVAAETVTLPVSQTPESLWTILMS